MFEVRWKHIRARIARKKFQKNEHPSVLHETEIYTILILEEIDMKLKIHEFLLSRITSTQNVENETQNYRDDTSAGVLFATLKKSRVPGVSSPARPASAPVRTGDTPTCAACGTTASPRAF
jgi:hypothetical protein